MAEILIIGVDDAACQSLAETLAFDGHDAVIETSVERAIGRLPASMHRAIVFLLNDAPPAVSGDALRRLRLASRVGILALVAGDTEADVVLALHYGADDCMRHPVRTLEFLARVQALVRRAAQPDGDSRTMRIGDVVVDRAAQRVTRAGRAIALSPCEYRLLEMLATRGGMAVSRKELLAEVWQHSVRADSRTVDVHVAQLRKKLERNPAEPQIIETVWRYGYRVRLDPGARDSESDSTAA